MRIEYKGKFQQQRKQTEEFLQSAHFFIERRLEAYIKKIEPDIQYITLYPLGGGIKSVVYEITTNNNRNYVLKICMNKYYYWNEIVGIRTSQKAGLPTVTKYIDIEDDQFNIYGFITDKVQYPILKEKIPELNQSDLQNVFMNLGRNLNVLHQTKVDGYIEFEFHSFTKCTSTNPYYYTNYMLSMDNYDYIYSNRLLTTTELKKVYEYLKSYEFHEKASVTHGDLSITNTFYTDNNNVLLFDFQSAGDNPLFDLATFKYRLYLDNKEKLWGYFLDGYGRELNEIQLAQLLGIICFRKLTISHQKNNLDEFYLSKKFLLQLL